MNVKPGSQRRTGRPASMRLGEQFNIAPVYSKIALAMLILALALACGSELASARYLPTRADEADVEVLKDLIRGIIEEAQLEQFEARALRLQQQNHKSGQHYQPSNMYKLERRSLEAPQASSGDNLLLRQIGSAAQGAN